MCVIWGQFDLGLVEHPDCQFAKDLAASQRQREPRAKDGGVDGLHASLSDHVHHTL